MSAHAIEMRLGAGTLVAVPAIHFSAVFASHVNAACRDPRTRPDAIAVELPAVAVFEIEQWLRELGAGAATSFTLPCMLGLVARSAATPGALKNRAVVLSATDSMIEAIRCAIELDVPLFGIDLDGDPRSGSARLMEDPLCSPDLLTWVDRNARFAESGRVAAEDDLREQTMAAHLFRLGNRYSRVLFTGGVGHWSRLEALLFNRGDAPLLADRHESQDWMRAVLHPSAAVSCIDRFPALVAAYEKSRPRADQGPSAAAPFDVTFEYTRLMQAVYAEHFSSGDADAASDLPLRRQMEALLQRLLVLHQLRVPKAATILDAAGALSLGFRRRLVDALIKVPWLSPADRRFASLPIANAPDVTIESAIEVSTWSKSDDDAATWAAWDEQAGGALQLEYEMTISWPPTDRLATSLSLAAMRVARHDAPERRVEPFTASLHDGLAVRDTIRSFARGQRELMVTELPPRGRCARFATDHWEPVVWIFREAAARNSQWVVMAEKLEEVVAHGDASASLRANLMARGSVLIEQAGFGLRISGASLASRRPNYQWDGYLLFQPTFFNLEMTAAWLEQTCGLVNPIASYDAPTSPSAQRMHRQHALTRLYRDQHHVDLDLTQWSTTMIRMAIPYAESNVTVIAPDRYVVPGVAKAEAAARGVSVRVVPHSFFTDRQLREISEWYAVVPLKGSVGTRFPAAVERELGPANANLELLPARWRRLGKPKRGEAAR